MIKGRTAAKVAAAAAVAKSRKKPIGSKPRGAPKVLNVCVLSSSYEGCNSPTQSVDLKASPEYWVKDKRLKFDYQEVNKLDSYRFVRDAVASGKYDVFFNLCDGAKEERRAGVDVIEALEQQNAAFTGADSRSFEPSKIDMKLLVASAGVSTPNFVFVTSDAQLAKKCRHLKFPVIVKSVCGYASVGIQADNKCNNLAELQTKLKGFLSTNNHALVEEFIRGREGTVLVCGDPKVEGGVRVFRPTMFDYLKSPDDFAYFDAKWEWKQAWSFMKEDDPAVPKITMMAKNAFKYIMSGVGYGRCDFRIDDNGTVYFLEINANCSMWSEPAASDGGDFADVSVKIDKEWNHDKFALNAIHESLRQKAAREPWICISHDAKGNFTTRASRTVQEGQALFGDLVHPIPVVARAVYNVEQDDPSVGCVILRGDGQHQVVAIRHSCEPNMHFLHGRTLMFSSKRTISAGEELTVDYATLRDESMPRFACSCGTSKCRSVIFAMPAMPRVVDAQKMKRLLREKKRAWAALADKEAAAIVTKRSEHSTHHRSSKSSEATTTATVTTPAQLAKDSAAPNSAAALSTADKEKEKETAKVDAPANSPQVAETKSQHVHASKDAPASKDSSTGKQK